MRSTNRNQDKNYLAYSDALHTYLGRPMDEIYAGMIGRPAKEGGEFVPAPIRAPEFIPHRAPNTPEIAPVEIPAKPVEIPAS